ncbi:hypothetical protein [Nitrosomonas nitrosa]|uniref:hypothetical protein n=1 Tax=Nitrosomonas nitrosa TaxID=52442 RepID=UPI000D314751|nr:hypothetical protein [Nitrosomonas nitrosa]
MTSAARACLLCKPTARHCEAAWPPWQSSFSEGIALTPDYFHLFITLPRVDPPIMTVQGIYYVIAANQHLTGLLRYARNDVSSTNLLTMQTYRASLRGGVAAVAIQYCYQNNNLTIQEPNHSR